MNSGLRGDVAKLRVLREGWTREHQGNQINKG
jgi:hypothetical protein